MKKESWKTKRFSELDENEKELRREWVIKERKRRKVIAGAVVAFLLLLIAVPIVIFTAFRLETVGVTVVGKMPETDEQIVAVSGAELGKNVLFFNLEKCEKSIRDSLPYASKVTVARALPSGLEISVEAAKETYALFLENKNLYLLLDENFRILAETGSLGNGIIPIKAPYPVSDKPGDMLAFVEQGEKEDEEVYDDTLKALKDLTAALKEEKLEKITEINVLSITDIKAVYDGRIMLKFGTASDLDSKADLAASAIGQENERNPEQIGTLNLSITKKAFFKQNFFDGEKVEPTQADEQNPDGEDTDENVENVDYNEDNGENGDNEDENGGEETAGGEEDNDSNGDEDDEDYREYYADEE